MSRIAAIRFRKIVRPLRTTFATSLGSKTFATSVLVQVELADGHSGLGEVPTSFVMPHETVEAISRILRAARAMLVGESIRSYERPLTTLAEMYSQFHMTRSGLEVALFRARLAAGGQSEHAHWGGKLSEIETDITLPFLPREQELHAWLDRAIPVGFSVFKVKVSGDVESDMRFVRTIHQRLSRQVPAFTIRLDGNQGYTARSFLRMLNRLEKARIPIELFEQPLRKDDYDGLVALRGRRSVPIILDETVFDAQACRCVIEENLADGVNIKIAKSGIAESRRIYQLARRAGLKLMIGCMTETMVGLSAGIYLAAGTGGFDYIDLDSVHLMPHCGRYGAIALRGCRYVLET